MKKIFIICLLSFNTVSCGPSEFYTTGQPMPVPGPTVTVTPSPTILSAEEQIEQDIAKVVSEENLYRDSQGNTLLTPGLSCALFTITGGQYIQSGGSFTPTLTGITQKALFKYVGDFNQPDSPATDGLNVLPLNLRSTYTNMFLLRCTGFLVSIDNGYRQFELGSDDGSVLYIDGTKLVDNDGQHGLLVKTNTKLMRKGVYTFRLDFAQSGGGNQALIFSIDGVITDSQYFYH